MGIKYGFCNSVKSRRINLGRSTLVCGSLAFVYSTDLTGTISQAGIGAAPLTSVTGLCMDNAQGACAGVTGSFFAQTASYNRSIQMNPMMLGCCSDHSIDEGKLINMAVGGVLASMEHQLSISGQGEPWALKYTDVVAAINIAIANIKGVTILPPPSGDYVPNSIDANLSADSWQQGTGTWSRFEGKGTDMSPTGILLTSSEFEYNISLNIQTGRVDGSKSKTAYYTQGSIIPCNPQVVASTICDFAEALNNVSFI